MRVWLWCLHMVSVGIGGHATHGGFGFTSRMWGMTLDTIVKLDVVLANGTITTATSTVNSELFWVCLLRKCNV